MSEQDSAGKILVIDDEPSTLHMLRLLLSVHGYTVLTAEDGEKGLEVFLSEKPPIVVTDVRMPGKDGIEVLKEIKEKSPDSQVIVVTGHGDMEMAVRSLQHDASDFINKPIQKQALEVALRRAKEKIELKKRLDDYTHNLERRVEEATADLSRSVHQLNTLFEISQAVGEMATLHGILDLLHNRIQSITRLRCHGIFLLNERRDGIVKSSGEKGIVRITKELLEILQELRETRLLNDDENKRLLRLPTSRENGRIALIPILRKGEPAAGAALAGLPPEGAQDEIRLAELLLSIAAGTIRRAVAQEEELDALRRMTGGSDRFGDLVGRHPSMGEVFKLVSTIAESDATVLIQGESGTGKELIARRIHELSTRSKGPFVVINCAAFPQTLLESELFGHEKGAFTGAIHSHRGAFEQAHGGTIFLDEIGEISLTAQVKLLRVIQFKEFLRLGSEATVKVDARILAATSRDLRRAISEGHFREDLYYRLHVIPIAVPPLRERMPDLPLLADHFLRKLRGSSNKMVVGIDPEVTNILMNHDWPGNIRELENVMEHAFVLARGENIRTSDLPGYLRNIHGLASEGAEGLEEVEKKHLIHVLNQCRGNKILAAKRLKISRSTLYRKLQQYQLVD